MRTKRFTFLCTKEEKLSLEQLAAFYRRTKGDTVRFLIEQAMGEISKASNVLTESRVGLPGKEESSHGK